MSSSSSSSQAPAITGDGERDLSARLEISPKPQFRHGVWALLAYKKPPAGTRRKTKQVFSTDTRLKEQGLSLSFASKEEAELQGSRDRFAAALLRLWPEPTLRRQSEGGTSGSYPGQRGKASSSAAAASSGQNSSAQDLAASPGGGAGGAGGNKRQKVDGNQDARQFNGGNCTSKRGSPRSVYHGKSAKERRELDRTLRLQKRDRAIELRKFYEERLDGLPSHYRAKAHKAMDHRQYKVVRQVRQDYKRETRIRAQIEPAQAHLDVLEKCSRSGTFQMLVEPTSDPSFRSKITTFTLEHVVMQSLGMIHYYKNLLEALSEELSDVLSGIRSNVYRTISYAAEKAAEAVRVSTRTIYRWRKDFEENDCRFSESRQGKAVRDWILDNETMVVEAKSWLRKQVRRKATKKKGVFQIRDFQDWMNTHCLPRWKVKPWKEAPTSSVDEAEKSKYLQISESTALAWAHRLGLCYARKSKTYYVDGHDRADVLAHRALWLEKEMRLELRQYLWCQVPLQEAIERDKQRDGRESSVGAVASGSSAGAGDEAHGGGGGGDDAGGEDGGGSGSADDSAAETKFARLLRRGLPELDEGASADERLERALMKETVYHYRGNAEGKPVGPEQEGAVDWVELHVDLLPQEWREEIGATVNGFKMGGRLSVRFRSEGDQRPLIKAGQDETIFKMYDLNKSSWFLDNVRRCERKTEGKGNMKSLFMDEMTGAGCNQVSEEKWAAFQAARKQGFTHENPALVHWEYGKAGAAIGQGYWTNDDMAALVPEWIEMMEYFFPNHQLLINVDYSSNHSAFASDARTLTNMRVFGGGERKVGAETVAAAEAAGRDVEREPMPVFKDYKLTAKDIGPNVPRKWSRKIKVGNKISFCYKSGEKPFYAKPAELPADYEGKALGKRELTYRLGHWQQGMTEKGGKAKAAAVKEAAAAALGPTKWKKGDLVVRNETDDVDGAGKIELYRIHSVPVGHSNARGDDVISCQWFEKKETGNEKEEGSSTFTLTTKIWKEDSYTAKTLYWVVPKTVEVESGSLKNKVKCVVELDLSVYAEAFKPAVEEPRQEGGDEDNDDGMGVEDSDSEPEDSDVDGSDDDGDGNEDGEDEQQPAADQADDGGGGEIDRTSLNAVLGSLPMFLNVKSKLEELVEKAGHILLFSSKYHAECAGQGIEYCFGRAKWWFRKYNRRSTTGLREDSKRAFESSVLTISHVRKYARKNRDYHRVYRAGVVGGAADGAVKTCKTHRSALDSHYAFVQQPS